MKKETTGIGIAMVYIGTLIGAGFASGQELFQFFGKFGTLGLVGISIASILFSLIGYAVLILSSRNKSYDVEQIVLPFENKTLKIFISWFFLVFLLGILVVMLAGSGAMFYEQFAFKPWVGSIVMMVLVFLTTFSGKEGIIKSFKIVVPLLIFGMLTVVILVLTKTEWDTIDNISDYEGLSFITSAILFVSCNMVMAVSVLVPLGKEVKSKSTAIMGALLGGVILGITGLLAVFSMITNIEALAGAEVPLVLLASAVSQKTGNLYSIILFAGIYTTAVGCLFALEEKLSPHLQVNAKIFNIFILITAFLLSDVGFSRLVAIIYRISGYVGLILLMGVTINFLKNSTIKS